jgi:hypothetical protein
VSIEVAQMDAVGRLGEAIKRIDKLREALQKIHDYADADMEGAGEPEFSQFAAIAGLALLALNSIK